MPETKLSNRANDSEREMVSAWTSTLPEICRQRRRDGGYVCSAISGRQAKTLFFCKTRNTAIQMKLWNKIEYFIIWLKNRFRKTKDTEWTNVHYFGEDTIWRMDFFGSDSVNMRIFSPLAPIKRNKEEGMYMDGCCWAGSAKRAARSVACRCQSSAKKDKTLPRELFRDYRSVCLRVCVCELHPTVSYVLCCCFGW